jgi:hypothetical protein
MRAKRRRRSLGLPDKYAADEPSDLFPRIVRVSVFRWMWAALVALVVVLVVLAIQYRQLAGV